MKQDIIKLAKEKRFEGTFSKEWQYSSKEHKRWLFYVSELHQWLMSQHNIFVEVALDQTTEPKFSVEIYKYSDFGNYDKVVQNEWFLYRTYQEALEVGLLHGLKVINNV